MESMRKFGKSSLIQEWNALEVPTIK